MNFLPPISFGVSWSTASLTGFICNSISSGRSISFLGSHWVPALLATPREELGLLSLLEGGLEAALPVETVPDTSDAPELTGASDTSDASETVPWVEAVDPVSLEDGSVLPPQAVSETR